MHTIRADCSKQISFFQKIISNLSYEKDKNIGVLLVIHALPDAIPFLKSIEGIFHIDGVFAKKRSVNKKIFDVLAKYYPIEIASRDDLKNVDYVGKFLKPERDGYIIIDVGGYFAPIARTIAEKYPGKLLGCVEDTENGLYKYLENDHSNFLFFHVSQSPLKQNEDYLVGQAISYSAESIFRDNGILLNGRKVGVLGYGKIGAGLADAFKYRQSIVFVNDRNPIRATHAYSRGYLPQDKELILKNCDIICVATGRVPFTSSDFQILRNGSYVFSVTSSVDSIDMVWLRENYTCEDISDLVQKFTRGAHYFYLVNKGNAINFIHGTTVGDFILLVQAEIIACAIELAFMKSPSSTNETSNSVREAIAVEWLKSFAHNFNRWE